MSKRDEYFLKIKEKDDEKGSGMLAQLAKEDYELQIHVMTINSGKLLYGLFGSEWFTEKQLLSS